MTTVFHAWTYGRFIERYRATSGEKNFIERINESNFLGDSFSNRDAKKAIKAPIQFRRESQPQHLKRWFFVKNRPIHFHINSTSVIKVLLFRNNSTFKARNIKSVFYDSETISFLCPKISEL